MSAAVFFDRDGTLCRLVERDGVLTSPRALEDFSVHPAAKHVVAQLRREGYRIFVASNQPDVARGFLPGTILDQMHERLRAEIEPDEIVVCVHDDAHGCDCRKPRPGMLLALAARWGIDLHGSYVVGDSWKDVEAGRRAGCRTILLAGPAATDVTADYTVPSLEAVPGVIGRDRLDTGRNL